MSWAGGPKEQAQRATPDNFGFATPRRISAVKLRYSVSLVRLWGPFQNRAGGRVVSVSVRCWVYIGRGPRLRGLFLCFFYYFLEHTEKRKPLETPIADFLVELGLIKGIHIGKC